MCTGKVKNLRILITTGENRVYLFLKYFVPHSSTASPHILVSPLPMAAKNEHKNLNKQGTLGEY